ncbi:MAG: hypothetical protein JKY60_19600 [Kordiimonadaceae bacterium]|nr:hypothetical protein [Kordiimonadaceae bacterium]
MNKLLRTKPTQIFEQHNDGYITTEKRGVKYAVREFENRVEVTSNRISLGKFNPGTVHFFGDLQEAEIGITAIAGLGALLNIEQINGAA